MARRIRPITVEPGEISGAIARAHVISPGAWQSEVLEILLIPKLYRRWQELNPRSSIARVSDPRGNGYLVVIEGQPWNNIQNHSPAKAFQGLENTVSGFAHVLRNFWYDWSLYGGQGLDQVMRFGALHLDLAHVLPGPSFGAVRNPRLMLMGRFCGL